MASGRKQYPFDLIESKWQERWAKEETFRAWNPGEIIPSDHPFARRHSQLPAKYYILDMFPYPSGAGLHVGHPEGYTATDILARYQRARGCHVLHPIGWDAFGLPAEQYAIKTGQHPRKTTEANIRIFKRQILSLGFSYDWNREIDTTDPDYYKWTQWIFLQIYNAWFNPETNRAEPIDTLPVPPELQTEEEKKDYRDAHRLAYVAEAPVNWCPQLGTVLANEEVKDGRSEVGDFPVIRKPMSQWMLRITAYAERLLNDLDPIDWSDSLKEMQRNWIGRSEGANVRFQIAGTDSALTVFTTRPDTLFGATYMVLSPEHPILDEILPDKWPEATPQNWKGKDPDAQSAPRSAVQAYRSFASGKSELERTDLAKEKTGVFTGAYAINPVTKEKIPIWTADYVLISYGTGAIMAVPAHDTRDLEFARKFELPIRQVVQAPGDQESIGFVGEGSNVNSDFLDGLPTEQAKSKITAWLEENRLGTRTVNYKLRDWLFSRQRYWGEPFPIVWKNGRHYPLDESELPLVPPDLPDFKPTESGDPPLAKAHDWVNRTDGSKHETNTMPQWAGSCWYYLRYLSPHHREAFCDPQAERYWMGTDATGGSQTAHRGPVPGVDVYIGGTEHAVLHLLYARFWHKVLYDLGHVSTPEPFYKLVNQGLILGEDSQKMSKSRGNVINPDDILLEYGADAFRLYEMFMGPLEMVKPWNTKGVEGVYRFLGRVWRLFIDDQSEKAFAQNLTATPVPRVDLLDQIRLRADVRDAGPSTAQSKALHSCIRKVTEDLDGFRFNTAISALMIFVNDAVGWEVKPIPVLRQFLVLLQPFAPHLAEELFQKLQAVTPPEKAVANTGGTLAYVPWPAWDASLLEEDRIEIPVQVNGKLRDRIQVPSDADEEQIRSAALASEKVRQFMAGKSIKKIIVVPKKVVNIAVG